MRTNALFSDDRRLRFWLLREWDASLPKLALIGVNPSTADETENDPTIRRAIGFAQSFGKGGLLMLNLYAYKATKPADLWAAQRRGVDVIGGPRNWVQSIQKYALEHNCDLVIAAWGSNGRKRGPDIICRWPGLMCLGKNSDGTPKHPLYLRGDLQPEVLA